MIYLHLMAKYAGLIFLFHLFASIALATFTENSTRVLALRMSTNHTARTFYPSMRLCTIREAERGARRIAGACRQQLGFSCPTG